MQGALEGNPSRGGGTHPGQERPGRGMRGMVSCRASCMTPSSFRAERYHLVALQLQECGFQWSLCAKVVVLASIMAVLVVDGGYTRATMLR